MSLETEVVVVSPGRLRRPGLQAPCRSTRKLRLFEPALVRMATVQSFRMLDPREMARNPVMFLVEVGTVLTAVVTIQSILDGRRSA